MDGDEEDHAQMDGKGKNVNVPLQLSWIVLILANKIIESCLLFMNTNSAKCMGVTCVAIVTLCVDRW